MTAYHRFLVTANCVRISAHTTTRVIEIVIAPILETVLAIVIGAKKGEGSMSHLANISLTGFEGQLAALVAAFLWALATTIYGGVGQLIPPLELNLTKGVIATAMLLLTLLLRGGLMASTIPPAADAGVRSIRFLEADVCVRSIELWALALLLFSGVVGIGLGDTAYLASLKRLGPRRTLLLEMLAPPSAGLIALILLGEKLSSTAWLGIGLTLLGVAWVVTERAPGQPADRTHVWRGIGFGIAAALAQASGAALSHAALVRTSVNPLCSAFLRLAAGVLTLLIWLPLTKRPAGQWLKIEHPKRLWGTIVFATFIGTYLAIWLQQTSLKLTDAGVAQTLLATSPLFALAIGAWKGERISMRAILGALVALAGIGLLFGLA